MPPSHKTKQYFQQIKSPSHGSLKGHFTCRRKNNTHSQQINQCYTWNTPKKGLLVQQNCCCQDYVHTSCGEHCSAVKTYLRYHRRGVLHYTLVGLITSKTYKMCDTCMISSTPAPSLGSTFSIVRSVTVVLPRGSRLISCFTSYRARQTNAQTHKQTKHRRY